MKNERILIGFQPETLDALKQRASASGLSVSAFVRMIVTDYLNWQAEKKEEHDHS